MNQLPTPEHKILADSIRRSRVLWGISTREELARLAEVRPSALDWAEKAEGSPPEKEELMRVAQVLRFTGEHATYVRALIETVLRQSTEVRVNPPTIQDRYFPRSRES